MGLATGIQRAVDFLASYYRGEMALEQSQEEKRLKQQLMEARQRSDTRAEMELQAKLAEAAGKREKQKGADAFVRAAFRLKGQEPPPETVDLSGAADEVLKANMERSGVLSRKEGKKPTISIPMLYGTALKMKDDEYATLTRQYKRLQELVYPGLYGGFMPPPPAEIAKADSAAYHSTDPKIQNAYQELKKVRARLDAIDSDTPGVIAAYQKQILRQSGIAPENVIPEAPPPNPNAGRIKILREKLQSGDATETDIAEFEQLTGEK